MKYLITGAAGFLGTNLALRLLKDGHEVIGLDNFHSGSKSNISLLEKNPQFSFIEHDVVNSYDIRCDVICNLACPASPPHYQRDPVYTLRISVLGTLHALENAERYKARLLQASTSEIYGDPLVHPCDRKSTHEAPASFCFVPVVGGLGGVFCLIGMGSSGWSQGRSSYCSAEGVPGAGVIGVAGGWFDAPPTLPNPFIAYPIPTSAAVWSSLPSIERPRW